MAITFDFRAPGGFLDKPLLHRSGGDVASASVKVNVKMMRRLFQALAPFAILYGIAAPALAAPCAPAKLVHIVVVDATPGIDAASFAAQPKNFYRIGSGKMRIEEGLDAANKIHGLIVTSEPDTWMVNLYDNTGKHIVDPGPTFNARALIFGLDGRFSALEFGCEADFISGNAPKAVRTEQIAGAAFDVYRVEDRSDAVEILERSGTSAPAFVRYYKDGKLAMVLRYDVYETGLSENPTLFTPPAGVRFTEANSP
jgi:hypothetical protein